MKQGDDFERFEFAGDPLSYVEHRDGIEWLYAPKPRRWHRCKPQTRGLVRMGFVERCACGATRIDHYSHWMDRNSKGGPSKFKGEWAIRKSDGGMVALGMFGGTFAEYELRKHPGGVLLHRSELGGEWLETAPEPSWLS
jgi:hypothetical protein